MRRQELILYRIFQEDRDRLLREIAELAEDYEDGIMNKAGGGTWRVSPSEKEGSRPALWFPSRAFRAGGNLRVSRQSVALLSGPSAGDS